MRLDGRAFRGRLERRVTEARAREKELHEIPEHVIERRIDGRTVARDLRPGRRRDLDPTP